eukprot:gene25786-biopygen7516
MALAACMVPPQWAQHGQATAVICGGLPFGFGPKRCDSRGLGQSPKGATARKGRRAPPHGPAAASKWFLSMERDCPVVLELWVRYQQPAAWFPHGFAWSDSAWKWIPYTQNLLELDTVHTESAWNWIPYTQNLLGIRTSRFGHREGSQATREGSPATSRGFPGRSYLAARPCRILGTFRPPV